MANFILLDNGVIQTNPYGITQFTGAAQSPTSIGRTLSYGSSQTGTQDVTCTTDGSIDWSKYSAVKVTYLMGFENRSGFTGEANGYVYIGNTAIIARNRTQSTSGFITDTIDVTAITTTETMAFRVYLHKTNTLGVGGSSQVNIQTIELVPNLEVTTSVSPVGSGSVTGDGFYPSGSSVTLTATPNTGYLFDHFSINGTDISTNPYTFTIAQDTSVIGYFRSAECTLDLSVSPENSGYINIGWKNQFPQGLRSAGSVYDEINETKAIKRVESVDLGTLNWNAWGGDTSSHTFGCLISGFANTQNQLCSLYSTLANGSNLWASILDYDKVVFKPINSTYLLIRDISYTDATTFKNAMSGVYLYYELATPVETDITFDYSYPIVNGGTESVNSSVPIIADILYPSGLKTDQTFISRQTTEDGVAKVKVLKGNTLKFNQLAPDSASHIQSSSSYAWRNFEFNFSLKNGHIYCIQLKGQVVNNGQIGVRDTTEGIVYRPSTGYSLMYTSNTTTNNTTFIQGNWGEGTTDAYVQIFDLTEMFGSGNEPTVEEFNSYFTDDYYPYNTGELLSFDGTEITTTNNYPIYIGYTNASFVFDGGTEITVEAVGSGVYGLYEWLDNDVSVSSANPYTFVINHDTDLVAVMRLSLWVDAVYDRTQTDIDNKTWKAFINLSDMQRIEGNVYVLSKLFGTTDSYHEWEITDLPTLGQWQRIMDNIQLMLDEVPILTPLLPDNPINTFTKVNQIEYITQFLFDYYRDYIDSPQPMSPYYSANEPLTIKAERN